MGKRIYLSHTILLFTILHIHFPTLLLAAEKKIYPTVINPVSAIELHHLQKEFDALNGNRISTLNQFGFTDKLDWAFEQHLRARLDTSKISLDTTNAVLLAQNALLRNAKFTNVKQETPLTPQYIRLKKNSVWEIFFGSQKYANLEVVTSYLRVSITGTKVTEILGSWYPYIEIPSTDRFDKQKSKERMIGEKLSYYDINGELVEETIREENIVDNFEKVIYPIHNENSIVLHVAWKIPIGRPRLGRPHLVKWHVFLDTTTGQIIKIIKEFRA